MAMNGVIKNFRDINRYLYVGCQSFITCQQTRGLLSGPSFKYADLEIEKAKTHHPKPNTDTLLFGHHFSDHMLKIEWSMDKGWGKPTISPVHNLSLHPAAKVFHYGIELFEGMKAYRGVDDQIRMFRPMENMHRMINTAERCCLPKFDGVELVKCIKKLIQIDESWVPPATEVANALYIRPTFLGTEPTLGVSRSHNAVLYVLTGPVGPYYPTGMKPVTLMAEPKYTRAWPGGCGQYKMGSNYAPTIAVQAEATERGCQQVLWLYGDEHQMTEVGTMNLFMHWFNKNGEEELVTAPLDGLVLPGVVRKSLIQLAKSWNKFKVVERVYTMEDLIIGLYEKRVIELFGSGTACIVSPVEKILYRDEWINLPVEEGNNSLTMKFYHELIDIQYGRTENKFNWMDDISDIE